MTTPPLADDYSHGSGSVVQGGTSMDVFQRIVARERVADVAVVVAFVVVFSILGIAALVFLGLLA
jgi:hypothetical protein